MLLLPMFGQQYVRRSLLWGYFVKAFERLMLVPTLFVQVEQCL